MFRRMKDMKPLACCLINKKDADYDRIAEEINHDYHNGDCEFVNELEDLKDLCLTTRYLVADVDDAIVVICPVKG